MKLFKKCIFAMLLLFSFSMCLSVPTHAKSLSKMKAKEIVKSMRKAGINIKLGKCYGKGKDVLSRYKSRAQFKDSKGDASGTLRTYYSTSDAKKRFGYISAFDGSFLEQYVYRKGNVVINVDKTISKKKWKKIKSHLNKLYKYGTSKKKSTKKKSSKKTSSEKKDSGTSGTVLENGDYNTDHGSENNYGDIIVN